MNRFVESPLRGRKASQAAYLPIIFARKKMTTAPKKPPPNSRYASEYLMAAKGRIVSVSTSTRDLLLVGDFQLVVDFVGSSHALGHDVDPLLLLFSGHRSAQSHHAVLSDDLDVLGIH